MDLVLTYLLTFLFGLLSIIPIAIFVAFLAALVIQKRAIIIVVAVCSCIFAIWSFWARQDRTMQEISMTIGVYLSVVGLFLPILRKNKTVNSAIDFVYDLFSSSKEDSQVPSQENKESVEGDAS